MSLVEKGAFHGEVLDVGCGTGALAIHLAVSGFATVGLDLSTSAIAVARTAAQSRGLEHAVFEVADATSFVGFDGRFGTVVDSALFHTIPPSFRHRYQQAIVRAAAPGASYFVLVFDRAGMPDDVPVAAVTADELFEVVAAHWEVTDITAARIHAATPQSSIDDTSSGGFSQNGDRPSSSVVISSNEPFPAWLLSAHLA
ncbi:class I SAM-dependent methyltransferase [Nocardia sp. NPDC052001]|uniref:class I SAM-dependent methyltransferase n=1 Tax=Nocardia sp. NPDC052001 TaxID=3154853 RepID=UPI00341E3AE2